MKSYGCIALALALSAAVSGAQAHKVTVPAHLQPGQSCSYITEAEAAASAGTPNVAHDGSPLPGVTPPDISQGFKGIPRSAQPPLTASQKRILMCNYYLPQARATMPYALFIPSTYRPGTPTALIVDLHGLNITPLQQMLFDGTTDFAQQFGFIVVAPMGFSVQGWWGALPGKAVDTSAFKPGTQDHYTTGELSDIDTMTLLKKIRKTYTVDSSRIYLMGHSMGGAGTYYLGAKYDDIWAAIAPISGPGGIPDDATARRYLKFPTLIMQGEKDSIVNPGFARRSALHLQNVGAQFILLEMPNADHEFWIRRNAKNMEKVFLFFAMVSKRNDPGFITPTMVPPLPELHRPAAK